MRFGPALACAAVCAVVLPAQAALWGYVDGAGVARFAPTQVDSRYSLVLQEARPARTTRVPGKTDSQGSLLTWMEIAPEVKAMQPLLREAAEANRVDIELLKAVILVESGFNARAVSPRGAVGLMQLTPETADRYATRAEALTPAAERLLDARINIQTGARMLADLMRRFQHVDVALAAWNAGEGTVRKHGNRMPPIDETQAHVHMVLELYWALLQSSQARRAKGMELVAPRP